MTKKNKPYRDMSNLLAMIGGLCIILGLTVFESGNGQLITLSLGLILPLLSIFYGSAEKVCEDDDTQLS